MDDANTENPVTPKNIEPIPKILVIDTPTKHSFKNKLTLDGNSTVECRERNGSIYSASASRFDMKDIESRHDLIVDVVPPDGGWGWVIVAASFYCCAVIDGFCSVVGVLLPKLLDHFEGTTNTKMALAGSLYAGTFLLSGIVASCCINRLGCKATTIIGSIITTVALIASTFAPTTNLFILLFGICGGFGIGLVYLPASVMVNYYFYHRRGLANGIACSGSGAGILIFSPLADFLAEIYGWKGCLIIIAGMGLQCVVCGALMRPLKAKVVRCSPEVVKELQHQQQQQYDDVSIRRDSILMKPTFESFLDEEEDDQTDDKSKVVGNFDSPKYSELEIHESAKSFDSKQHQQHQAKAGKRFAMREFLLRSAAVPLRKNPSASSATKSKKNGVTRSNTELASWAYLQSLSSSSAAVFRQPGHFNRRTRLTSECLSLFEHNNPKNSFCSVADGRFVHSVAYPNANCILENIPWQLSQGQSMNCTIAGQVELPPLKKIDIFYSGSIATLTRAVSQCPGLQSSAVLSGLGLSQHMSQELSKPPEVLEIIPEKEPAPPSCPVMKRFADRVNRVIDFSLFQSIPFLIISLSSVFIQLGFFVPILFLSDHAQKLGMTAKDGAILLSVLGGSNMIGRALAGALASVSCINVLHLNCLSLIVSGLATAFVFTFTTFQSLIFYSLVFGLFVAFFTPLTPLFLVKYLGLEKLTNSFGLLSMIKGIATMVGPPLAAGLYTMNQSYDTTFLFGGAMFICAGIVFYLLAFTQRTLESVAEECTFIHVRKELA